MEQVQLAQETDVGMSWKGQEGFNFFNNTITSSNVISENKDQEQAIGDTEVLIAAEGFKSYLMSSTLSTKCFRNLSQSSVVKTENSETDSETIS